MKLFDTKVQYLKYRVLKHVAEYAMKDQLIDIYRDIPHLIIPGKKPNFRCCVYKERAIIGERIHLALGGKEDNPLMVEVIEEACDECPVGGLEVTAACRGCIAHRCVESCPKDAITFDHEHKAVIDKEKCIECGRCQKVCPYNAIIKFERPCEKACHVNAIAMDEDKTAVIDASKCIECGACVYQCPFGAISDKSQILDVVNLFKEKSFDEPYKMYAIVAPSIASQFSYASLEQVIAGLKLMGFDDVVEAALGADYAAMLEAHELAEKKELTSSCCPSFVKYVHTAYPKLSKHVSHNPSPMLIVADFIKSLDETAKVVFIGPCIAKKREALNTNVDAVLTFEELQALIDSFKIDLASLQGKMLDNASFYGRIFARTGGLTESIRHVIKSENIDFDFKPVVANGIKEAKTALMKMQVGRLDGNFIEGMACEGGCIGGPCCLSHGPKDLKQVDAYGRLAHEKTIKEAIKVFNYK